MAAIKIAYVGGGSTRAPGTVAAYVKQGEAFAGSTITLIDPDREGMDLTKRIALRLAAHLGVDLTVETATDLESGLTDADAVLSSFRPGGFEMRGLDESIPLKHGVIGQETQGPGGFFMALRSVNVVKTLVGVMARVAPKAVLYNYTNPVNIVAQAVSLYSDVPVVSLCEGPIVFPEELAAGAGLEPGKLDATMVGLNHACFSVRHEYDGLPALPVLERALERLLREGSPDRETIRRLELAVTLGTIPASYMKYYYYRDEVLEELRNKPTTRAQDIMAALPTYRRHYREQAEAALPRLEPEKARGGIFELELAVKVMNSAYNGGTHYGGTHSGNTRNGSGDVWTLNVPNRGALRGLPDDLVVEVPCLVTRNAVTPLVAGELPRSVRGLVYALGAYQDLTARAAWEEDRTLAVQALASNPLVPSLPTAKALYEEMAGAQAAYLAPGLR